MDFFAPDIPGLREEAISELKQLLSEHQELAERLGDFVTMGSLLANQREWWQAPKATAVRHAAEALSRALNELDWLEFQLVERAFDDASRDIFEGWVLPENARVNPEIAQRMDEFGDDAHDGERGFLVRFHAQARRLATANRRRVGRPVDDVRRRIARGVGEQMLLAGIMPPKSDSGLFASVLRILFRRAKLGSPVNMFEVTVDAMKEIAARLKNDAKFAAAVARAAGSGRSIAPSSGTGTRTKSSRSGRPSPTRRRSNPR